jgi:hypothetical protein
MPVKWIAERLQICAPGYVICLLYRQRKADGKASRYDNIKKTDPFSLTPALMGAAFTSVHKKSGLEKARGELGKIKLLATANQSSGA